MQNLTVAALSPPIPRTGRTVHVKGESIEFDHDQIIRLFWAKVNRVAPAGCWEWLGRTLPNGYGQITIAKRHIYSHRVSFEIHKGEIPTGLHIDHLCRNRRCCNPEHLEAVTCRENVLRSPVAIAAKNATKTHCVNGHEFTQSNTIATKAGRACRTCHRWRDRVAAAKKSGRNVEDAPPSDTVTTKRPVGSASFCAQGHLYDDENTYLDPRGNRKCRACAAEYRKRYKATRRALPRPGVTS